MIRGLNKEIWGHEEGRSEEIYDFSIKASTIKADNIISQKSCVLQANEMRREAYWHITIKYIYLTPSGGLHNKAQEEITKLFKPELEEITVQVIEIVSE